MILYEPMLRYLASIWTKEPCIRYCDICKDFKVETRAIHRHYV